MAMHGPSRHTPGHTPFRKTGWGPALFISALAVASFLGAFAVHNATFNDPYDPLSPSKGRQAAAHGEAAADHGAEAGHAPTESHAPAAGAADSTVPSAGH